MTQVADLLIELGTEELPPKALRKLSEAFAEGVADELAGANFTHQGVEPYASPRRLAVKVKQVSSQQPDSEQQRLGPAVEAAFDDQGKARPAAQGFARSCGVEVEQLDRLSTEKGERLAYTVKQQGKPLAVLLPELLTQALKKLPIPKYMRWGASDAEFVRPVHWLVVLHGSELLPVSLLGVDADRQTFGHRFHAPAAIALQHSDEYPQVLQDDGKVIAHFAQRRELIKQQIHQQAAQQQGKALLDDALLDEVTGLVEWPVALTATFDAEFLQVPQEALIATMQADQKYFPLLDDDGKLLPRFVLVSNIDSSNPKSVIEGNEKVVRPRLADAQFFYQQDRKQPLHSRKQKLQKIVFQKQLGSLWQKSERVALLAGKIAEQLNADVSAAKRAALLAKCDLATDMVGEFPELQGIMGTYYARHDGEPAAVANAIAEHYQPRFSGDQLPASELGSCLAIAERVDTLVGIFGINQPPTGTKDPFALRRSAIGLLRLLVEKELPLDLAQLIDWSMESYDTISTDPAAPPLSNPDLKQQLLDFLLERFRAWYQEQQIDTRVVNSVLAVRPTRPLDFARRVDAVAHFQSLEQAEALSAANKRVSNILAKADESEVSNHFDESLLEVMEERELADRITHLASELAPAYQSGDYRQVLEHLAQLREPVDSFFDHVMVNAEDDAVRRNRLSLLNQLRRLFIEVADISQLQA